VRKRKEKATGTETKTKTKIKGSGYTMYTPPVSWAAPHDPVFSSSLPFQLSAATRLVRRLPNLAYSSLR